ncbi:MAG TPA: SAM-dependent chlorinase/fluorinase [Burkholderiales bacterium]|nr:SAM-dependent chlorinase/fluorinase [Burkholderiales bacterium]
MAIFLYTDFGSGDVYVGQVKAVLQEHAPDLAVVDLLHDAPAFNVRAGAHLLAALAHHLPAGSVVVAVVDPGVGSERRPVAVHADERWYVGPDNGLLSVLVSRAARARIYDITWRPVRLSSSFHGRDLFAPIAGMLARSAAPSGGMKEQAAGLEVSFGADDLPEIIYMDHFGNAMTGLRPAHVDVAQRLHLGARRLAYARVFSEVKTGAAFWYVNSLGLAEIAVRGGSAAQILKLKIGQRVRLV